MVNKMIKVNPLSEELLKWIGIGIILLLLARAFGVI